MIALLFCLWSNQAVAATFGRPSNYLTINTGLVGWWTFDGRDTNWATGITKDKSGNGNDGSLIGMSTTTSPVQGKLGQALAFDGANSYVNLGSQASLTSISYPYTISTWVKYAGTASTIFDLYSSAANNSSACVFIGPGTVYWGAGAAAEQVYTNIFDDRKWHHLLVMRNAANSPSVYIDGNFVAAGNNTGCGGGGGTFDAVGELNNGGGRALGSIDDVRLYNRALSTTEIKALYNVGAEKFSISPQALAGPNSGLVGWWTFDGKDMVNNVADRSGNGNNGFLTGFTSTSSAQVQGKLGQALSFNGSQGSIKLGNPSSLNDNNVVSYSFWVKPTSPGANGTLDDLILSKGLRFDGGGFRNLSLYSSNNTQLSFEKDYSGIDLVSRSGVGMNMGIWNHVVMTWNGSAAASGVKWYINGVSVGTQYSVDGTGSPYTDASANMYIGRNAEETSSSLQGALDDVRAYNRALSAAEIQQLYSQGAATKFAAPTRALAGPNSGLVGWWTFDGRDTNWATGITSDKSGSGNGGQLIGLSTTTSPVQGKIGQALSFNGSSQFITVPMTTDLVGVGPATLCAWVYPINVAGEMNIVTDGRRTWFEVYAGSGQFNVTSNAGTGSLNGGAYKLNTWQHFCFSRDVTGFAVTYLNGSQTNSGSSGTPSAPSANELDIANSAAVLGTGRLFNGQVDDVRVYNRVLSPQEITQIYNMGR